MVKEKSSEQAEQITVRIILTGLTINKYNASSPDYTTIIGESLIFLISKYIDRDALSNISKDGA